MNQQGESKIMIIDASKPVELEHAWCLWFDRYIGRGFTAHEYADAIKKVFEVKTIQEFWRWYNNLPGAAALDPSCTYHLMKSGIRPLWEDPSNVRGGNMTAKISCKDANDVWMKMCLVAISGQFDEFLAKFGDRICGVSIGMRKTDASIYIWNADAKAFEQQRMLMYLEEVLCDAMNQNDKTLKCSLSGSAVYKVHQSLDNFGNEKPHENPKPKAKEEGIKAIEGGVGGKKKTQRRPIYEPVRVPIEKKHPKPRKMDMKVLREKKTQYVDVPAVV